jgi:fermentation-respiration switch protein FrsA (DUF1100 family)
VKALSFASYALGAALAVLVLAHALVYFAQERMIFFPQPLAEDLRAAVRKAQPDAREIELATADGQRLQGWFVPNGGRGAALIYFGGNAEEVSGLALEARELPGISFVLFNYRGYGQSTGKPGERALFADALAIYVWAASRPGIDRSRIVVMGRSLGSGVATYVAAQRPVAGVVLVTPYDSLAAVGRSHYPFLAVGALLRHRFDSASRARTIDAPMLALIGGADTIIPPQRGEALVRAWRGPATAIILPAAGHNDIGLRRAYWQSIREFLRKTGTTPTSLA